MASKKNAGQDEEAQVKQEDADEPAAEAGVEVESVGDEAVVAESPTDAGPTAEAEAAVETEAASDKPAKVKKEGTAETAQEAISQGMEEVSGARYVSARQYCQDAFDVFDQLGDETGKADALVALGVVSVLMGEYDEGWSQFQQALALREQLSDAKGQADIMEQLGHIHNLRGENTAARQKFREAAILAAQS